MSTDVGVQVSSLAPEKDAIIDTKRINDCVLCFLGLYNSYSMFHNSSEKQKVPAGAKEPGRHLI